MSAHVIARLMLVIDPKLNEEIVRQHAEEAAFAWTLRERALDSPCWSLRELQRIEARLQAHLEALLLAGSDAWAIAAPAWTTGLPGECAVALIVAAMLPGTARFDAALGLLDADEPGSERAVATSLAWLPEVRARELIEAWSTSASSRLRRLALAASLVSRRPLADPDALAAALASEDPGQRALALELLAALARPGPGSGCVEALDDPDVRVRLAGALGLWRSDRAAHGERLVEFVAGLPEREELLALGVLERRQLDLAVGLGLAALPGDRAQGWLTRLTDAPEDRRLALVAAAAFGDPALVPWLIEQTADPTVAQTAGYAIVAITGVDLDDAKLDATSPPPDELDALPDSPEGDMPWPDREALARWWSEQAGAHPAGSRGLWGRRDPAGLRSLLRDLDAPLRLRELAAWQLAGAREGARFPCAVPAAHQLAWLESR